ncbi:hypothetical protein Pelo_17573 [Pelomyxa schiedti]|nr:hypothetical protein Pelo_17573 [Pelomyxa schiedti]
MGDEGDSYEAPKTSNKALTDALEKLNNTTLEVAHSIPGQGQQEVIQGVTPAQVNLLLCHLWGKRGGQGVIQLFQSIYGTQDSTHKEDPKAKAASEVFYQEDGAEVEPHMDKIEMLEHITNSLKSNLKVWVSSMQPKSVKEMIKLAGQREAALAWKEDHEMKKGKVLTTKKDESDDTE